MKLEALVTAILHLLSGAKVQATTITTDSSIAIDKTFDYLITGCGLSGSVLGNKLSKAGYSVLVIEAGADVKNDENVNLVGGTIPPQYDWNYTLTGVGRELSASSGKGLGGSTSINGMVWYRPTKKEMDLLGELSGDSGWSANNLLPYLNEVENFKQPNATQVEQGATFDIAAHGTGGLVNTSFSSPLRLPRTVPLYRQAFAKVMGSFSGTKDLSARENTASANTVWNIWHDPETQTDRRSSAATAFLYAPSQQRNTLTILTEHHVGKVVLNGGSKKATGLTFASATNKGALYTVKARKEVILSAGALSSAAILQRSGIGAKSDLEAAGVQQLVDSPGVGKGLYDQPGSTVVATFNENIDASAFYDVGSPFAPFITLPSMEQIFHDWAGQYSQLASESAPQVKAAVEAGAFVSAAQGSHIYSKIMQQVTTQDMPVVEMVGEAYPGVLSMILWPLLPFSRGHLKIASADPFQNPVISPRFLSHPFDLRVAVAASKKAREIFQTEPLAAIVGNPFTSPFGNLTDAEFGDWFKSTSYGASHWGGSASMLPKNLGGVVDGKLNVYGVNSLRVIDASVLPLQITSHTQPMLYALTMRAADLILGNKK